MKGILNVLRKRGSRLSNGESGFTLVELLVVVGIIVALAAVIIPNVATFAGKGDEGAKAAERDNIQSAIDTFMTDTSVTAVTARDAATATSTNAFGAGAPVDLTTYLRETNTKYFYCWDSTGLIKSLDEVSTLDCSDTN